MIRVRVSNVHFMQSQYYSIALYHCSTVCCLSSTKRNHHTRVKGVVARRIIGSTWAQPSISITITAAQRSLELCRRHPGWHATGDVGVVRAVIEQLPRLTQAVALLNIA